MAGRIDAPGATAGGLRPPVTTSSMDQPPKAPSTAARPIVWIGTAISLAFLYLFLRNVHWADLKVSLAQAEYFYILPALLLWLSTMWLRAIRWRIMVRHLKDVSTDSLISSMSIGFMATNLLPGRVGEFVRPAVLARREGLKFSGLFATIVVERIFDLLSILFFMVLCLWFVPTGQHAETMQSLRWFGAIFALVIAAAVTFLILLRGWPDRVKAMLEPFLSRLPKGASAKFHSILDNFAEGLGMLTGWAELVAIMFWSLLLWLVIGLINWVLSFAFGIPMTVLGGCLIFVCTAFAIALPQAPSFIGVFHVAVEGSLRILGAGTTLAKSYAIVLWAISVFPPIALGLYFLYRDGLSLAELTRSQRGDE